MGFIRIYDLQETVFLWLHFSEVVHSSYEILKGVSDTSPKSKNYLLRGQLSHIGYQMLYNKLSQNLAV